jgi:hypothetical protein
MPYFGVTVGLTRVHLLGLVRRASTAVLVFSSSTAETALFPGTIMTVRLLKKAVPEQGFETFEKPVFPCNYSTLQMSFGTSTRITYRVSCVIAAQEHHGSRSRMFSISSLKRHVSSSSTARLCRLISGIFFLKCAVMLSHTHISHIIFIISAEQPLLFSLG